MNLRTASLTLAFSATALASMTAAAQDFVPGRVLVKFTPGANSAQMNNAARSVKAAGADEIGRTGVYVMYLPQNASPKAAMSTLKVQQGVQFAELDRIVEPSDLTPNDPYFNSEWAQKKMQCGAAWQYTVGNPNITVAILDTGVDGTHPDLAPNMVPGWNIYSNNSDTTDVYGHGTKVAGAAGASGNNATGIAGTAFGCKIMPIRISATDGTATYSAMAAGLNWATDHGARVANISYEASESSTVQQAAKYAFDHGVVVCASAGNYGTFTSTQDCPYILTVGATDPTDALYSWSNTGNNQDLVAPGQAYTTYVGGGYNAISGTSFSSPFAAGVAALVLSANPGLSAAGVQQILKNSAVDLGTAGWDTTFGAGRVNAYAAVTAANSFADTTPPTVNLTSPTEGATLSGTITINANATDDVSVAGVDLQIDGTLVGTFTGSTAQFSWNTATYGNGAHTVTAIARDATGNTSSTTVNVQVSNVASDTQAPTVSITSPAAGTKVSGTVTVTATAGDNVGVTKVELYVDGKLASTSTIAPFTTSFNSKSLKAGTHTLVLKAYDAAGNSGLSQSVTVTK